MDDDYTTFQVIKVPHVPRKYYKAEGRHILFAVKSGVAKVTVTGEEPFTIFSGGCWNLKPGQSCLMGSDFPRGIVDIFIMGRIARGEGNRSDGEK